MTKLDDLYAARVEAERLAYIAFDAEMKDQETTLRVVTDAYDKAKRLAQKHALASARKARTAHEIERKRVWDAGSQFKAAYPEQENQ